MYRNIFIKSFARKALKQFLKRAIIALPLWTMSQVMATPSSTTLFKTVAIVQIIEHAALDATRQGIIDTLKKELPDVKIQWESAQGSPVLAAQICQNFVCKDVDIIVAIGTTAAQSAINAAQGRNIPVVFASVTDPESAKLTDVSTGVSNFVDVQRQLNVVWQALPCIKTLGMIYNPGEAFSDKILALTQDICLARGIKLMPCAATKTSEVAMAAQTLAGKVDAIFINNDNTALAAFPVIVNICNAKKIPVFGSDTDLIEQGALAVLGPNQYRIGEQTANIIQKLLGNLMLMKDIEIAYPDSVELCLNIKQANLLGIKLDDDFVKSAQIYAIGEKK